ncbi:MAG: dTDP-4-amino-4,6-dideoxygalactose transaminase [Pseudomonadota bacterium]
MTSFAIPFHRPSYSALEEEYVRRALASGKLHGAGEFTARAEAWLRRETGVADVLLTSSCTHALEMAALLLDVGPGDEVICPGYTFVSTASAFALRGARLVFVDIDPGTMSLDVDAVRAAISPATKGIVAVHYAGACGDLGALSALADAHGLWLVEDAAQGVRARWRGRALGSIGRLGACSFHATKNFTAAGEGGALLVNDPRLAARAEILRDKGTDRARFLRGEVDGYGWQALGSSYLMTEMQAAFLCAQFERADEIQAARLSVWRHYHEALAPLEAAGRLCRPRPADDVEHNAHTYFLRTAHRDDLLAWCRARGVEVATHFVPLHETPAGRRYGEFRGEDRHTANGSAQLLRLPLWAGMQDAQVAQVIDTVRQFFAAR